MKTVKSYCKNPAAERMVFLHPIVLMILAEVLQWCDEHGISPLITETVTTLAEDEVLNRTSNTHRTARAFDLSTKGWSESLIDECVHFFSKRYFKYAAVNAKGENILVYHHDAGTGEHLHFQINSRFSIENPMA